MKFIETIEELRQIYGEPGERAVKKQLNYIDAHSARFLSLSPFALIASQDLDGNGDVTPKGDAPGFVRMLDKHTLALPDRPGNNRLDSWQNLLANPAVGMLFMIPGMDETLRINGTAKLTADPELCEELGMNGRPARAVMVVKVHEVYMHCAKAFIRSKLWHPTSWPDRGEMPTLGEILHDQVASHEAAESIDQTLEQAYRDRLW
ncbi:pyridoxamine 5'-phosphate oxidase family protein [Rhodobacteraceae bacterium D3-12]|nr:pyridoxamine 5'-phosphate oxidase family protein [Rhodobacteraceae bacterium D3-12]